MYKRQTRYTLKEDGLPLALGLSLVSTAKRAWRNRLNIEDELSKILDPIAALDKTTDVLISALLAAVLEDDTPDEVVAPLVKAFIGLQLSLIHIFTSRSKTTKLHRQNSRK